MSSSSVPLPLQGFARLNKTTYLLEPQPLQSSSRPSLQTPSPDLILIPTWMNAQPRPISKYTAHYQSIYPSARILLITTTTPDVILRSNAYLTKSHADALSVLLALPKTSRVLVHAFSNGGALTLAGLAKDYKQKTGVGFVMDALVLDSTPGRNHWDRAIAAFEAGLSKSFLARIVGGLLIRLVLLFYFVSHHLLRSTDRIENLRSELNNEELFSIAAKRLYIFSEGDKMVWDKDIKDHVNDARGRGYIVQVEEFVGTQHVGHVIGDEQRYWGSVRNVWSDAVK